MSTKIKQGCNAPMGKKTCPDEEITAREKKAKVTNANWYLRGHYHASTILGKIHNSLDLNTTIDQITTSIERIISGKTTEIEAKLITQAKVLEYVFYDSTSRMYSAEMEHAEIYGNMALRAQNQSRKALLALVELKNPRRTMFVKQQNNAINQQINNAVNQELIDSKNSKKVANELLSEINHETLDFRGTSETIGINQTMEAVEISRSEDS